MRARHSRSWWKSTVDRFQKSGLSAKEFAEGEDLSPVTLRWWTVALRRKAVRASERGRIVPLEVEVAPPAAKCARPTIEIAVGEISIRVDAEPGYVAELVRRLEGR